MKTVSIDHLVYAMKNSNPQQGDLKTGAIFFLGAGMSKSGGIPLASEIVNTIKSKFKDNPFIKDLDSSEADYAKLMNGLLPSERNLLLKKYVDDAKVNVGHLYLANLLKNNYADYILTVNFDNLMFKAATLLHLYPATYDMAILKDLTTSNFHSQSIIHLHGHFQGPWLLNTTDEMGKVKDVLPKIFDAIKHNRPWIFIGYSGDDPVFDHLTRMGRFDNGLYWIGYKDIAPSKKVQDFLSNPHTNGFLIKGYDADSFMRKLNDELAQNIPLIWDKPFSYLKETIEQIIVTTEDFSEAKNEMSVFQVDTAIDLFGEKLNNVEDVIKREFNYEEAIKESILYREILKIIETRNWTDIAIRRLLDDFTDFDSSMAKMLKGFLLIEFARQKAIDFYKASEKNRLELIEIEKIFDEALTYGKSNKYLHSRMSVSHLLALCLVGTAMGDEFDYLTKCEDILKDIEDNFIEDENKSKNEYRGYMIELYSIYLEYIYKESDPFKYFDKATSLLSIFFDDANNSTFALQQYIKLYEAMGDKVEETNKKLFYDKALDYAEKLVFLEPKSYQSYLKISNLILKISDLENKRIDNFLLHPSYNYIKYAEDLGCDYFDVAIYYKKVNQTELSAKYLKKALEKDQELLEKLNRIKWESELSMLKLL